MDGHFLQEVLALPPGGSVGPTQSPLPELAVCAWSQLVLVLPEGAQEPSWWHPFEGSWTERMKQRTSEKALWPV